MRMPRPRFTLRRLMIAVAVAALGMWFWTYVAEHPLILVMLVIVTICFVVATAGVFSVAVVAVIFGRMTRLPDTRSDRPQLPPT